MGKYDLKDIVIHTDNVNCKISLSGYGKKFEQAEANLERQIAIDMLPYMPEKTGYLKRKMQESAEKGNGRIMVAAPPYGMYQYEGVSKSGKPLNYKSPTAESHWWEAVKRDYSEQWVEFVRKEVMGK